MKKLYTKNQKLIGVMIPSTPPHTKNRYVSPLIFRHLQRKCNFFSFFLRIYFRRQVKQYLCSVRNHKSALYFIVSCVCAYFFYFITNL